MDEKEMILCEVRRSPVSEPEPNWLVCQGPSMAGGGGAGGVGGEEGEGGAGAGNPTERKDRVHSPTCLFRKKTIFSKETRLRKIPEGV